jgi:hypothetical protein
MDDAQGLKRPANPSRYTLSLQADGRAVLQLDCNRATGSWQVEPSSDPGNGGFRFGPLASTKALCPAPSLAEPLARQLPYVRGYLLRDGRLNLSLLADGGILIWEPRAAAGPGYSNRPDPALETAILAASPDLRRLADDFCDPLELRNDSTLGVLGIVFVAMALKAEQLVARPAELLLLIWPLLALYGISIGIVMVIERSRRSAPAPVDADPGADAV